MEIRVRADGERQLSPQSYMLLYPEAPTRVKTM